MTALITSARRFIGWMPSDEQEKVTWDILPNELIRMILSQLPSPEELRNAGRVCWQWRVQAYHILEARKRILNRNFSRADFIPMTIPDDSFSRWSIFFGKRTRWVAAIGEGLLAVKRKSSYPSYCRIPPDYFRSQLDIVRVADGVIVRTIEVKNKCAISPVKHTLWMNVGSALQGWNLHTGQLVHSFNGLDSENKVKKIWADRYDTVVVVQNSSSQVLLLGNIKSRTLKNCDYDLDFHGTNSFASTEQTFSALFFTRRPSRMISATWPKESELPSLPPTLIEMPFDAYTLSHKKKRIIHEGLELIYDHLFNCWLIFDDAGRYVIHPEVIRIEKLACASGKLFLVIENKDEEDLENPKKDYSLAIFDVPSKRIIRTTSLFSHTCSVEHIEVIHNHTLLLLLNSLNTFWYGSIDLDILYKKTECPRELPHKLFYVEPLNSLNSKKVLKVLSDGEKLVVTIGVFKDYHMTTHVLNFYQEPETNDAKPISKPIYRTITASPTPKIVPVTEKAERVYLKTPKTHWFSAIAKRLFYHIYTVALPPLQVLRTALLSLLMVACRVCSCVHPRFASYATKLASIL